MAEITSGRSFKNTKWMWGWKFWPRQGFCPTLSWLL